MDNKITNHNERFLASQRQPEFAMIPSISFQEALTCNVDYVIFTEVFHIIAAKVATQLIYQNEKILRSEV